MRLNWFLIVNVQGQILAVYGSSLAEEAQAKARELRALGFVELRLVATSKRPRVGAPIGKRSLSMAILGPARLPTPGKLSASPT